MIKNIKAIASTKHGIRPAERKQIELFSKNGIASNRQGICYGSRMPGQANEHFKHDTDQRRRNRKRQGQRIVKG